MLFFQGRAADRRGLELPAPSSRYIIYRTGFTDDTNTAERDAQPCS